MTHQAVVTVAPRAKLEIHHVDTISPGSHEILVCNEWTSTAPLDLHQADGGLLVKHPQTLGDVFAGTVKEVGPNVTRVQPGDEVMGFAWRTQKERAHQEVITVPDHMCAKRPEGLSPEEAVTVPTNFVTVFHTITAGLGFHVTWPLDSNPPEHANVPIVIWGASSSVGQYAIQILSKLGYGQLFAVASSSHHKTLRRYGATECFDYRKGDITAEILQRASEIGYTGAGARIPFIFDCIGSRDGSVLPISKIAEPGTVAAILLPVVLQDATDESKPEYSMDVNTVVSWLEGVVPRGIRTHHYMENELFKQKLQSEMMPALLAKGFVEPNKVRIVEGSTMLERAQNAMDILRRKEVSGEKLVWRVAEGKSA